MENRQAKSSSTITKDPWVELRSVITHLYLDCDYPLRKVLEIMRDQYGFVAPKHQYKAKFNSWNARKNLNKAEKLSGYAHIQENGGVNDDSVLIRGKSRSVSQILRPVQRKGKKMIIVPQGLPNAMQNDVSWDFQGLEMYSTFQTQVLGQNYDALQTMACWYSQGVGTLQKQILQESPESSTAELILRHINVYYRRYPERPQPTYYHTQSLGQVFDVIDEGLNLLLAGEQKAYKKFHEACDGANKLFKDQPFQITVQFSACFSQSKWSQYPDLRGGLMRFLTGMAIEVLGPNDYLPKILKLMLGEHTSAGLSSRVIRLTTDTTLSRFQDSSTDLLDCMAHLSLLVGRMHRDTSEESALLSNLSQDVLIMNLLGEAAPRDVSLVYKLGNLRLSQNRLDEAKDLLTEAIALAKQSPDASGARISKVCMLSLNCMGVLYGRRKDSAKRTQYYREALEWSTNVVPNEALNGEDKRRRLQWLEDVVRFYTKNGDVLEVQSLREQYYDLWAELDQEGFGGVSVSGAGT